MRLLIAGCGDLGQRLAARLSPDQWQISGLKRHPEGLPAGIHAVAADLTKPDTLAPLASERFDAVVFQATPSAREPAAYRQIYVDGLANLLDRVQANRLLFVSSTAVYGQNDGEWVDEDSPTEPTAFNGRILLEAEQLARQAGGIAVRFSGIYGPGRERLVEGVRQGRLRCRQHPPEWTNRIHADDCAGVLAHLLALPEPAPVYCASDNQPASRCDVLDWLADRLSVERPERDPSQTSAGQGKRVDNRRLRASGYHFDYPDYRSGYGALLT
ncbi:MAG: SDR family oxidoreductase [Wenzhouxiangella sp.]